MTDANTRTQFVRYALVGLASNLLLYLAYLVLTAGGLDPKSSMSLLYALGVAQTFLFNKRWSFRHGGMLGPAFARYCIAYGSGYAVNLLVLILLVDRMGYPHEIVQGVMVLSLAVMLFLLQKFWVFRSNATPSSAVP
ncbi:MAG: GtrA family protein [Rhodocyclaceae bacterium]|nr:GtrA family protein [Rhodocyclaceae bacterium]